jgi:hypothetical protein
VFDALVRQIDRLDSEAIKIEAACAVWTSAGGLIEPKNLHLRRRRHWRLDGRQAGGRGCNVSVVARGADAGGAARARPAPQREGDAETTVHRSGQRRPAALGVQDLVVVSVKAPGMADVARRIAPADRPHTPSC